MAVNAPQITYVKEIVNGFDKTVSILRDTVTNDYMSEGGSAVFLVSNTSSQTARTRGLNGQIPADPLSLTQNTATLVPWHKLVTVNDFNMFTAQSNLAGPMQAAVMAAINRKIDDDIITLLNTGSVNTGSAIPATINLVQKSRVLLGNAKVPNDGNLTLLCTPAFIGYLMQATEFSSADYVTARPYTDGGPAYGDMRMVYKWMGLTIIEDPTLPGVGTSAEKCFLFHKSAVGHAISKDSITFGMGYNEEQDYSFAKCKTFIGSVLLQNSGVVVINHDGSALSA